MPYTKFSRDDHYLFQAKASAPLVDQVSLRQYLAEDNQSIYAFTVLEGGEGGGISDPLPADDFQDDGPAVCSAIYIDLAIPRGIRRVKTLEGRRPDYWGDRTGQAPELAFSPNQKVRTLRIAAQLSPADDAAGRKMLTRGEAPRAVVNSKVMTAAACSPGRPCLLKLMADVSTKQYLCFEFDYREFFAEELKAFVRNFGAGDQLPDGPVYLSPGIITDTAEHKPQAQGKSYEAVWTLYLTQQQREAAHRKMKTMQNDFHSEDWDIIKGASRNLGFNLNTGFGLQICEDQH